MDDDGALIAAARAGSASAFPRLVDRHQEPVRAFLRTLISDHHEAEDLAQETFLTAWTQLPSWRGDSSLRTWLCAIAWRKASGARRALARGLARDNAYAERTALEQPREVDAEDRLALAGALATLPFECRGAVSLCLSGDFSHAEAAGILGIPVGTVKSHVARGRERLLRALGGEP